ncbi:MAG: 16S rRNA (cytidine(1402)-2'-O)-methyltransferase [Clostridia bacterium]|nr:16S rRNA (cytidine(1402)-2'-O)-methyltransferase [Clostridia bacterium]MBQ8371764.1 16S rRNA (cytidine(1402)-2'-O)-methyltransferase [Clostridia bacterium]
MEQNEKNKVEASTLYLVGTPIGNLADMSERAKKVLSEVDFIAAEDTRNSLKLLSCYGIHKELVSYFEHNKAGSGERIVARLLGGESCALITDAGMPAISDPGEDIVKKCAEAGIRVSVVPGCCAAVSALALSALATSKFCFEGFLSAKASERRARLEELKHDERTTIFYEAPHKLRATLLDMRDILGGERKIALCRELTKLNEEILRFCLSDAVKHYENTEPRGEYVLVVEGGDGKAVGENPLLSLSPEEHVAHYEAVGMKRMDAIKAAAKDRGVSKSSLYQELIGR